MKSKKRHEMQTNILADWLGRHIEQIKPYANTIVAALIVVSVGAIAASYLINRQSAKAAGGWEAYFAALNERDSQRLSSVAADYPATVIALWAKQSEGDLELARGNDSVFSDRDAARDALTRARDCFQVVGDGAAKFPPLQHRAQLGLAQAHESLGALNAFDSEKNDLETAANLYDTLAQASPGTALASFAQDRADLLRTSSVDQWYNWFSRQKPALPVPPTGFDPGAGLPGIPGLPKPMTGLSDLPDFSAMGDDAIPVGGEASNAETSGEEPPKSATEGPPAGGEAAKPPAPAEPAETETPPPAGPALTPPKE